MDTLPASVNGWMWWFINTIIMAIGINLLAAYLFPKLEKTAAKYSEKRLRNLEERTSKFQEQVKRLKADRNLLTDFKIDSIILHLQVVLFIVSGLISLNIVPMIFEFFRIKFYFMFLILFIIIVFTLSTVLFLLNKVRELNRLIRAAKS